MTGKWPYNTAEWKELRATKLAQVGACEQCGTQLQLQVHHLRPVTPKERHTRDRAAGFPALEHLQVLCRDCHSDVTAGVNQAERRRRVAWRRILKQGVTPCCSRKS